MSKEEKLNRVINLLETKNESLELIKKKKNTTQMKRERVIMICVD